MEQTIGKKMGLGVLTAQDVRVKRNLRDLRFLYAAVLVAFVTVAVISAFLWSRLMVVNIGYEISKANSQRAALVEKNKRLRIEFMKLKSPDRIERIAKGELRLSQPTGGQIVQLK